MNSKRLLVLAVALGGAALLVVIALSTERKDSAGALDGTHESARSAPLEPRDASALPTPLDPEAAAPSTTPGPARVASTTTTREAALVESTDEPAEEVGAWSGRVLSDRGLPLRDAAVTIGAQPPSAMMRVQGGARSVIDASMATGADGRFTAPRKKAREEPWVEVRAAGYRVLSLPVGVAPGAGDRDLGTLVLEPGAVIVGQVVDVGGLPVPEVRVRREPEQSGMVAAITNAMAEERGSDALETGALTDADGRFELSYEDPGAFVLEAHHAAYPPARVEGEARAGETCAVMLRFAAAASIAGRLTGFPEGKQGVKLRARLVEPSAGAAAGPELAELFDAAGFGASDRAADVGPDGSFLLQGLVPDRRYELVASLSLGMMQRERCTERKEVEAGARDVELAYDAGARIVLRLVATGSGEVLRDADLRHEWLGDPRPRLGFASGGGGAAVQVAADGTLTLEELRPPTEPGRLRLIVRVPGYLEHEFEELLVPTGEVIDIGTIALKPAARVRVRVVDATTGEPVARARVRLADARPDFLTAAMRARGGEDEEEDEELDLEDFDFLRAPRSEKGSTDAAGICELPGFLAQQATLEVKASKYAPFRRDDLVLVSDGLLEELVQLHSGGTVVVRVVDGYDKPAARARVQHRAPEAEGLAGTDTRKTGSDGVARFQHLPPGEHSFRLAAEGEDALGAAMAVASGTAEPEEDWSRVSVGEGVEKVLVLALAATARLEGRVTASGRPLADASVTLHAADEDETAAAIRAFQAELIGGGASSDRAGQTDAEGRFVLEGAEPGSYELHVAHVDRRVPERVALELHAGVNEVDLDLPSTRVEGHVADGAGHAIAGARLTVVHASEADASVREVRSFLTDAGVGRRAPDLTDALGRFTLEGLPAGVALIVEAKHDDCTPGRSAPFELSAGESKSGVDIVLEAGGRLRISAPEVDGAFEFVNATYEPVADEEVPAPRTAMLRAGRALMTGMRPGTWRVRINGAGTDEGKVRSVQIRAGEESAVQLER